MNIAFVQNIVPIFYILQLLIFILFLLITDIDHSPCHQFDLIRDLLTFVFINNFYHDFSGVKINSRCQVVKLKQKKKKKEKTKQTPIQTSSLGLCWKR